MTFATAPFLEYSDAEHRYFSDGKERPSVTQILDAAGLISPFSKDEEARFRGSRVHELCADDDKTPLDLRQVPRGLRGYLRAWRRYKADTGFQIVGIENRVDCPDLNYSGRYDRLGFLSDEALVQVLDIKTSKTGAIPEYARLQLSAYAHALDARRIFGRIAVALKPDGTYSCKSYRLGQYYTDRAEWFALLKQFKETANGHG